MTKSEARETDHRLPSCEANLRRACSSGPFLIRSRAPFPVGLDEAPRAIVSASESNETSAAHDPRHTPSKLVVLPQMSIPPGQPKLKIAVFFTTYSQDRKGVFLCKIRSYENLFTLLLKKQLHRFPEFW